ncbi:SDR family oxidoreductase [Candidatus Uabimicrobium sp. HlEnr_7]|uniref:SDR family oxidoreductase n=1 Tax=Candidatus Uabimicrobium helgolandensis TaxID=3095367 RepID=UPI0035584374
MKLQGNKILITGGSAGIGLALAKKFVELDNEVLITGRTKEKLDAAKSECNELMCFQCDGSDPQQITELSQSIQNIHPDMNVLINNAGVLVSRNLLNKPESLVEFTKEVDINVKGTVLTTSLFLNQIEKNKGTIINVSSGLAFVPMMSAPIYCATKAFIHSFTTSLRYQLESQGVEVVELAPPAVKTNMTARLPEDGFFDILSTDELVKATISGLKSGKKEICPGQASKLRLLSRLMPDYIERKLAKASRGYMPKTSK